MESLGRQTRRDFEVVIVDNSGKGLVRRNRTAPGTRVIESERNLGFGAAINQGIRASHSAFIATLNDDAVAHPGWLAALLAAVERRPDAGMCASQVRFFGEHRLDSAGMLVCARRQQQAAGPRPAARGLSRWPRRPSSPAARPRSTAAPCWRRSAAFDDRFFLYCEDTDLGLRARWAGWKCLYVPEAVVEHHYSHSAGRASPLKAYYVERNRLFVLAKNFPAAACCWPRPLVTLARYFWHAWYLLRGRGSAARFRAEGHAGAMMPWYVLRAHCALAGGGRTSVAQRRQIRATARITPAVFRRLLRSHSISARKVAAL